MSCNPKRRLPLVLLASVLLAAITAYAVTDYQMSHRSEADRIADFYHVETAVSVSPHHLRKAIAKGDDSFILVDLRSQEEYEEEHIVGAINIPAYADRDTSDYGAVDRISDSFANISQDKEIIVYCYSGPCMTGRKVGALLADQGIYVKHLGIGWNEWRYHWQLWNHPHEWDQTAVDDYVVAGSRPGSFAGAPAPQCTPDGAETGLGC